MEPPFQLNYELRSRAIVKKISNSRADIKSDFLTFQSRSAINSLLHRAIASNPYGKTGKIKIK